MNKAGGVPTSLLTGQKNTHRIIVDKDGVYFNTDDEIRRVSKTGGRLATKGGGKPVILASKVYAPSGLAADGASVYWAEYADNTVKRLNVEGGPTVTVGECGSPVAVAVDSTSATSTKPSRILKKLTRFHRRSQRIRKRDLFSAHLCENPCDLCGFALDGVGNP